MRIAVFLSEDYDFTFGMMKDLIPELRQRHILSGVVSFPSRIGKHSGSGIYAAYLRIFGPVIFANLVLRSLIKRCRILLDYILGRRRFYSFESICRYYETPYLKLADPNSPSAIKWIKDNDVDVVLVFLGHILKREMIESAKKCVLNKHSSLLPSYKGILPVFWAMMNNDKIGVTIHKVSPRIDAGETILQKSYETIPNGSVYDYYRTIYDDTTGLISESLELISQNKRKVCDRVISPSTFGLPARRDYAEFRKRGHRFV